MPASERYRRRRKLSRLLVVLVLLFSGFITLLLTAIQLYLDYRYDVSLIEQRLQQIEISNLDSVSRHLWTLNYSALRLQMEGLLRQPDLIYMEVVDAEGATVAAIGYGEGKVLRGRLYPVLYQYRGETRRIGTLVVVATLDGVYQRLWDTFLVILVTQAIKTFLVTVFILLLFQRLVTRHLDRLAEVADASDVRTLSQPWALDRPARWYNKHDELEALLSAFNRMRESSHATYKALMRNRSALQQAQHVASLGSWEWDRSTGQVFWSREAARLLGWRDEERITEGLGRYLAALHPEDRAEVVASLSDDARIPETMLSEHRIVLPNGEERHIELRVDHHTDHERANDVLIGVMRDVSDSISHRQALEYMANYDALTNLPNRWLLQKHISALIEASAHTNEPFSLALLDLDGFKEVNDNLGHYAGDQLLRQIKPRLEKALRRTDFVARLGGDEFAIIFQPIRSSDDAVRLVDIIRQAMTEPFLIESSLIQVGASVGVALYPEHTNDPDDLLRYADVAMYQAKRAQAGCVVYDSVTSPYGQRRMALLNDMGRAMRNEELVLYYQPKVEAKTGKVCAVEVLVRWQHPEHGFVLPGDFIPLFELTDLIHNLTDYVLRRAMFEMNQWQQQGYDLKVAVNISARDLMDRNLPRRVREALDSGSVEPAMLQLEITENDLMNDPARAQATVEALAALGIQLAIDDFGTGYSSLNYLKHLRVHELKIDRSFVRDMLSDENDAQIVKSTIDLAHNLGLVVTAEGVESQPIQDRLSTFNCEMAQGYHIAKPMPADVLKHWLSRRSKGDDCAGISILDGA